MSNKIDRPGESPQVPEEKKPDKKSPPGKLDKIQVPNVLEGAKNLFGRLRTVIQNIQPPKIGSIKEQNLPATGGIKKETFASFQSAVKGDKRHFGKVYSDNHPELKQELDTLQRDLDSRFYLAPLSVDVSVPTSEHPIDSAKAKEWVDAHPDEASREVAQAVIDHTQHISFDHFERELVNSIESLNEVLRANPGEKFVVMITPGKSNQWVAELAMRHLVRLPDNVISTNYKGALPLEERMRIVFFDDAIYSGTK